MSIAAAAEAGPAMADLSAVMNSIIAILEDETALVRAGRLRDAARLEPAKAELSQRYYAGAARLRAMLGAERAALAPDTLAALERKHDEFRALLQINLTVLATAHAVSEGIMRGVSDELSRKAAPSTYGATGRANAPAPGTAQPLAVSRVL